MKYQKALLCITLAGTLIFSGCGSTNNSTGNNTNTSSSVESTVETSTEDTDAKSDENTVTGMISEITDSTITVATMPGGGQGEAPGNPPDDNNGGDNGSAPADKPDSDSNDQGKAPGNPPSDNNGSDNNSAPADKPDSDGTDSTETPDNQPSGDNTSAPSDNGGAPDMGKMSTETINLTDSIIYYDKDGKETTLSALSEGTMVTITFDDDGNAATVTISDGGNAPGGGAPGGSASSQPESYNAVTEYTEDTEVSDASFSSTGSDENAILVSNGANVTLKNITLDRTSSDSTDGDSSSFYEDHLGQHQPA